MEATKWKKYKNNKGQMTWMALDLSGLSIYRERSVVDGKFYYPIRQYDSWGGRIVADFNSLAEAKAFVEELAGA